MKILEHRNDPHFRAVFVRQSSVQIRQAGGLFSEAQEMFRQYGAIAKQQQMVIVFPSGAEVSFKVMGSDKDVYNFDGGQYTMIIVDEAQHHSQVQVMYLMSRLRSKSTAIHQMICTCNPMKTSFLLKFVEYCLDEQGIPDRKKAPKQRWFAEYSGDFVFADTKEELLEKYPTVSPTTYTFHPANVFDNPVIVKRLPDYVNRLMNLKRTERLRLLDGSWYAQEEAAGYWKRQWCEVVDKIPPDAVIIKQVRGYDLAASPEPDATSTNKNPDYTAGVLLARDSMGTYYVVHATRYRKRSGEVVQTIIDQAYYDGLDTVVGVPRDGGAGGVAHHQYMVRTLSEHGILTMTDRVSGHAGKLQRFLPFASLCESGGVKIVRGDWNDMFFNELEEFEPNTRTTKKDD